MCATPPSFFIYHSETLQVSFSCLLDVRIMYWIWSDNIVLLFHHTKLVILTSQDLLTVYNYLLYITSSAALHKSS